MKKTIVGLGVFGIIAGIAAIPSAQAYQGDPAKKGPNYSPERHAEIQKAFETNDYESWKSLMEGRGKISQVITQDTFSQFAKAHILFAQGQREEAISILTSIGLAQNNGNGAGNGWGRAGHGRKGVPRAPTNEMINPAI